MASAIASTDAKNSRWTGATCVIDRDVGRRDAREGADLAGRRHAELEHGRRVLGPQAQEREGQAVLVVEVALGLAAPGPRVASSARRHVLRRRLADRAGDADDRDAGAAAHVAGEVGECARRVGHAHDAAGRRAARRRGARRAAAAPLRRGLGEEVVAVEARPADRDEEGARREGARVDRDAGDATRLATPAGGATSAPPVPRAPRRA